MISEWEQWAVANRIVQEHGDGAADHAAERIVALEAKADDAGAATWGLVLLRIAELQRRPGPDDVRQ